MKAMMLTGIRQMEMRDVPDPRLQGDTDVLVRMRAIGVCGSDVHYYTAGRIGDLVVEYPYAVGHECAGLVEQVGPDVDRVRAGDRVVIDPAISCGSCDQCKTGRRHTCREIKFLACPGQAAGCLSDYIVMPQECCYPIRPATTFDQAALAEPLSVGVYAVKLSVPMPGAKIGILGAGPIGLSVLLAAKAQGAEAIYATDKIDARLAAAAGAGAIWTANAETEDVASRLLAAEPLGLDVVFECCGQQEALDEALKVLRPGGKLMVIGIPTVDRVSLDVHTMRQREICVQNVRRQVDCIRPALDLVESGQIDADFMITHHFSLEQSAEAFDLVADYADGVIKAVIALEAGGE